MRTIVAGIAIAVGATWSLEAGAQLQPPPPMQPPPPGTTWGAPPMQQPQPMWGRRVQPQGMPAVDERHAATAERGGEREELSRVRDRVREGGGGGGVPVAGEARRGHRRGPAFGLGAGVRFLTWTLGARVRYAPLSTASLWHIDGEVGFHVPFGAWDPYLSLHGGYATGSINEAVVPAAPVVTNESTSITATPGLSGGEVGGAVGEDYYFSALVSLGLEISADALFLTRSASTAASASNITMPAPTSASDVGFALNGSLHLGLHFDL